MTHEQKALLAVLHSAILEIRTLGYEGKEDCCLAIEKCKHIADVAEIVHNIPSALRDDSTWDSDYFLNEFAGFDDRYSESKQFRPWYIYLYAMASDESP